jgi:HPt (histidine-containing phosphotransfer) domain-containing protein
MHDGADPAIDDEALAELLESTGGDTAFLAELIETYLDDAPRHISAMRDAAASGNAADLARAAHALKGASGSVGATGLSGRARTVEMAARDGDVDDAEARIDELERELDRVATALRDVAATGESRSVD